MEHEELFLPRVIKAGCNPTHTVSKKSLQYIRMQVYFFSLPPEIPICKSVQKAHTY